MIKIECLYFWLLIHLSYHIILSIFYCLHCKNPVFSHFSFLLFIRHMCKCLHTYMCLHWCEQLFVPMTKHECGSQKTTMFSLCRDWGLNSDRQALQQASLHLTFLTGPIFWIYNSNIYCFFLFSLGKLNIQKILFLYKRT